MPAKTTIFNARAVAVHNFNLAPRNTVLFSPHGRFVLVAGFGNLAGQMDIYDLGRDYAKLVTIEASNASVCEWSPDGKHILTATTSPRLRVDNGLRIWHVSGGLMYNEDMNELYDVHWRPQSPDQHPLGNPLQPLPTPHASALEYLGRVKTPSKPAGAYRPPGARGTVTPLHFKREDEGGAAYVSNGISSTSGGINGFGKPRRREVPGADPAEALPPGAAPGGGVSLTVAADGEEQMSKAALKNKKKREAKKAKDAAERVPGLAAPALDAEPSKHRDNRSPERRDRRGHERSRSGNNLGSRNHSQRREGSRARGGHRHNPSQGAEPLVLEPRASGLDQRTGPTEAPDLTVTSPGGGSAQEKKVRSLLKKIRAIEDLKMRQAGGEKLEDTQVKKIATEDMIRKELDGLGFQG